VWFAGPYKRDPWPGKITEAEKGRLRRKNQNGKQQHRLPLETCGRANVTIPPKTPPATCDRIKKREGKRAAP